MLGSLDPTKRGELRPSGQKHPYWETIQEFIHLARQWDAIERFHRARTADVSAAFKPSSRARGGAGDSAKAIWQAINHPERAIDWLAVFLSAASAADPDSQITASIAEMMDGIATGAWRIRDQRALPASVEVDRVLVNKQTADFVKSVSNRLGRARQCAPF